MKIPLQIMFISISGGLAASHGALVAFWDFNDGFGEADEIPQIVHLASAGTGVIFQQRADTDGNGQGGKAFVDGAHGIDVADGKTMAWDDVAKSGDNDGEFFVSLATVGFRDLVLSMDVKGNADAGIVSYDLKYSLTVTEDVTNPGDVIGTIKDFAGGISTSIFNNQAVTTTATDFTRVVVDLSGWDAVEDQATVVLRFDDWKENDSLSIDNLLITGDLLPEPSVASLSVLGLAGLSLRRRTVNLQ